MKKIKETNTTVTYKGTVYQGTLGDFATEWWTPEDWKKHRKHVDELKKSGEYGKPFEIETTLNKNPQMDTLKSKSALQSYRFGFLDFSKKT